MLYKLKLAQKICIIVECGNIFGQKLIELIEENKQPRDGGTT